MTIQSVRVVSKSIATCERFKQWLTANAEYQQGEIDILENDPVLFTLRNTHSGLLMKIKGAPKDYLSLVIYTGLSRHIAVRYLENVIEDDGDEYLSALNGDTFERSDLHHALECFMARWDSLTPEDSITAQPATDTRKRIIDILRSHNAPNKPKADFDPINVTMTPHQIVTRLKAQRMVRSVLDNVSNDLHKDHEQSLCAKHLDTRVEYIDTDGAKAISPTVRKMLEDTGVAVFENDKPVGYTGNKDNHGFGSLDHYNW